MDEDGVEVGGEGGGGEEGGVAYIEPSMGVKVRALGGSWIDLYDVGCEEV